MLSSIKHLFNPISTQLTAIAKSNSQLVAANIALNGKNFPPEQQYKVAIFGLTDSANNVRSAFYRLQWKMESLAVVDLGNVIPFKSIKEKGYILEEIKANLHALNIICIVLGEEEADILHSYKELSKFYDKIDWIEINPKYKLQETAPLRQLLLQTPNHLQNIEFLAGQTYYNDQTTEQLIDKLYLNTYSLGFIRENIAETEPLFRSAHAVHFNLEAIKASEIPKAENLLPNGLFSHEAAILARYAGISNCLQLMHFTNLSLLVSNTTGAELVGQLLWYFLEGVNSRFNDEPQPNNPEFIIYKNQLVSSQHEIIFYKSIKSNRWWMQIPNPYSNSFVFVACSYSDYELVLKDEMPNRWWKAYQRLM